MTPTDPQVLSRQTLGQNLRHLCSQHVSVAEICRATGINRQQFNKYLAGQHHPSAANLRLIARFFGLDPKLLYVPVDEFESLVDGAYFRTIEQLKNSPKLEQFLDLALGPAEGGNDAFTGTYNRYHYSSIYPGKVVRAACCIYRNQRVLQHYYVERFPSNDFTRPAEYIFKYHGFTFPVEDRVFMVDFETAQNNELTFTVCAPQQRSARKFMFGITCGIAATALRQPFATMVAMHYVGPGLLTRSSLERSTVLDLESDDIPQEVRSYLKDAPAMIRM